LWSHKSQAAKRKGNLFDVSFFVSESLTVAKHREQRKDTKATKKPHKPAVKRNPIQRFPFNCKITGRFYVETRDGDKAAKEFAETWLLDQLERMTAKEYGDKFTLVTLTGPGKPVDRKTDVKRTRVGANSQEKSSSVAGDNVHSQKEAPRSR
jgi:hypothetical protein